MNRMIRILSGCLVLLISSGAQALDFDEARHLLSRTGFGATEAEIRALMPLDHRQAVSRLLDGVRTEAVTPPPESLYKDRPDPRRWKRLTPEERKALRKRRRQVAIELVAWWYREMIDTPSPLTERMTLFWHNHFTSSLKKVKSPLLMYRQNLLLRRHALGSFRDLLHAIARDGAMLLYLDGQNNRKGNPNENFARELLELFTLGEGHYSEQDVKEAARAFTGWRVDRRDGSVRRVPRLHDDGLKTFLGRTGYFDGDDIIDIILQQPRVALHITEKLWREFVSDTPDPAEVQRIAQIFRDSDYRIRTLMEALLNTPRFRAPDNRGTLVKSPVELLVGVVRLFRLPVEDPALLVKAGRRLGQVPMNPPNVKGWPGGTRWITSQTLLARQQLLQRLLRGREMGSTATMEPGGAMETLLNDEDTLRRILLPIPPVNAIPSTLEGRDRLARLILDPVFQLK